MPDNDEIEKKMRVQRLKAGPFYFFLERTNLGINDYNLSLSRVVAREALSEVYAKSDQQYDIDYVYFPKDWCVSRHGDAQSRKIDFGNEDLIYEAFNDKRYLCSYPKIAERDLERAEHILFFFFKQEFSVDSRKRLDQITKYFDERYWEWKKSSPWPNGFSSE